MTLTLSDFDYFLDPKFIAQYPSLRRENSRLLVCDRGLKTVEHKRFYDIISFLRPGDLLVLNDTKVLAARLYGRRKTGGKVEILLLEPLGKEAYRCLIKPLGRLKDNEEIVLDKGFSCCLKDAKNKIVSFPAPGAKTIMEKIGLLPLPPYIRRRPTALDKRRYQTVFAAHEGAVAAPTAGLHFTGRLLNAIRKKGVSAAFLTLHVNYATFSPVRSEDILKHRMQEEEFFVPEATICAILRAKKNGGRVIAVGTTVCKTLEDIFGRLSGRDGSSGGLRGKSRLFIHPPFSFKATDALVTNFHLPRTTLLMLVSAFAGKDLILHSYKEAISRKYRFYSYGDAMLIL